MSKEKKIETVEMQCAEEDRKARLILEWTGEGEDRKLTGVQCDNPRLQTLEHWECGWSCWQKVEKRDQEK